MKGAVSPAAAKRWAPRVFCFLVLGAQLYFVVRAYHDPHAYFGYQPFRDSSVWQAELFRVLGNGRREPLRDGWEGYHWDGLVRDHVNSPWEPRHAKAGIASTLDFIQKALDWVADHTPRDHETIYLEAHLTFFRNRRGPYHRVLRSHRRIP